MSSFSLNLRVNLRFKYRIGEDPCREGRTKCGPHSSCVVEGQTFKCICDHGYENDYRQDVTNELNIANCIGQSLIKL